MGAYTYDDGTPWEADKRPCSFEYHGDGEDRAVAGDRATGRRYHEGHQRYIVFNGYVCDMHAEEIIGIVWL